jgi:hypothetical protein
MYDEHIQARYIFKHGIQHKGFYRRHTSPTSIVKLVIPALLDFSDIFTSLLRKACSYSWTQTVVDARDGFAYDRSSYNIAS